MLRRSLSFVLLVTAALLPAIGVSAQEERDHTGVYTGLVTEFPIGDNLVEIVGSEVVVTIDGRAIEGREEFVARRETDRGEFVRVIEEVTQWVEFSGLLRSGGRFSVAGRSYTEWEIVSCEGDASTCSGQTATGGNSEGYPVTVEGEVADGVVSAEILWGDQATYAFVAFIEGPQEPSTTTSAAATTTTAAATGTAPGDDEYGVIVRDGVVHLTSPPGDVLSITRADLPRWAADLLVTVGAMHATAGPPGILTEGDGRVLLDGLPVVRVGDRTSQGGRVADGTALILVNGVPAATYGSYVVSPMVLPSHPFVGGPILGPEGCPPADLVDYRGQAVCGSGPGTGVMSTDGRAGDTRVTLRSDGEFDVGDGVVLGSEDDATVEMAIVAAKGSLILDRPLTHDHPAGSLVFRIPAEHAGAVPAPGAGLGAPGGGIPSAVVWGAAAAATAGMALILLGRRRAATTVPAAPPPDE